MEFSEGIKSRRAIRNFQAKEVPTETLDKIFELAKWVPVIELFHQWTYHILRGEKRDRAVDLISKNTIHLRDLLEQVDPESRQKAIDFYPDLGGAPVLILQTIPVIPSSWDRKYMILISGIALSILMDSIHYYGLGDCGITISPWVEGKLSKEFGLSGQEITTALAVGYPAESPKVPEKLPEKVIYL